MWVNIEKMDFDRCANFCADAIEPIFEINSDPEAAQIFYQHERPEGVTAEEFAEKMMRKCLPLLLKDHRETLVRLFALNQGITPDEYRANTNPLTLSADIAGMISDPWFRPFFALGQKTAIPSSSALENIAD